MFNDSKYTRWYFALVEVARSRQKPDGYCEKHHVIPKSLGGHNGKDNLVFLTAREHLLCHYLLSKMGKTTEQTSKLKRAFSAMVTKSKKHIDRKVTGRIYQSLREAASISSALRDVKNRFNAANCTDEYREKMRQAMLGRDAYWRRGVKDSEETRKRKSEAGKRKIFTPEHRAALSMAAKKRWNSSNQS